MVTKRKTFTEKEIRAAEHRLKFIKKASGGSIRLTIASLVNMKDFGSRARTEKMIRVLRKRGKLYKAGRGYYKVR